MRVDARGSWDALLGFVAELAALPETVVVDDLVLRWSDAAEVLEISFRAGALRVRAELAGCDEVIAKPVTRGSVARVLDGRGVWLPCDARGRPA